MRPISTSQLEMVQEAVTDYERAVTPDVLAVLAKRGLTAETVATFRLGVVSDPHPGHAQFRGMLAIPYLDKDNNPLTVRFRCLQEHDHRQFGHGKYMSISEDPSRPFNIRAIHQAVAAHSEEMHVTEGEIDAMILSQLGFFAIAVPGANLWQNAYRRMLAGFNRVWTWGDPDEAGAEFTNRLTRAMRQAKPVRLRDGDVNDTFLKHGADHLIALTAPTFD